MIITKSKVRMLSKNYIHQFLTLSYAINLYSNILYQISQNIKEC